MLTCVTGGTGFVGSHVVRALLADGHQVRVLHRPHSKLDALIGLDYQSAHGDVTDADSLARAFVGCDWVFHVAAVADYWRADPAYLYTVNVDGTRNVLEAAQRAQVKRVIFTSSAAAIGLPDDDTPSDEHVPFNLRPQDFPYGYSKVQAEAIVEQFVAQGLDVVTVNPSVVIGAGDLNMISGSYIMQVAQWQWLVPRTAGGIAVSDVRDIAESHLAAAKYGRTGERYLLNTANYSNEEWFSMIADVIEVAPPLIPLPASLTPLIVLGIRGARRLGIETVISADQARLGSRYVYFDASKAHRELHQPRIDMHDSVEATYRWYCEQGYLVETRWMKWLKSIGRLWHRG